MSHLDSSPCVFLPEQEGLLKSLLSSGSATSPEEYRLQPHVSLLGLKGFKVPLISPSFLHSAIDKPGQGLGGLMFEVRTGGSYVSHRKKVFFL